MTTDHDSARQVVVRLDGVHKEYGDAKALDGLSLEIRAGDAVAVMGPSGCGKSTLLNMVAGLDRPTSGTVEVQGHDLGKLNETGLALFRRRNVGMIFQFFNLIDDLPVLDNVALAAQLTGTSARQARRRALELLDELGVAKRRNNYPATLSGGERQRVAVARALMNRPALLLADEPTGALDSRSGEQVMDLLIDLNQIGQTLLIVTHDPQLATRCASQADRSGRRPGRPREHAGGDRVSAVWRASRAAVKRRRLQTFVIGLVVLCSTTTVLLALALLSAASGPFDKAYAAQRGAHTVAAFDTTKVSQEQLARTARQPGVEAAAGPFGQAVVDIPRDWLWMAGGTLTVVGRADPAGPVDRIELLEGHWATAPGEIVVNWSVQGSPGPELLGTKLETPGGATLTVVGFAASMSKSGSAWVSPEQMAALHPTSAQMLYRFTDSSTEAQLSASLARATTGLPKESLTGAQTYLTLKQAFSALADSYLPFITLFGILGLLVSTLIVGNVVSGAVVSGYRHIGVLKALGFTPNQVVAVYLTMLSVPAVVGCVLGTLVGNALAGPILKVAFSGIEVGRASVGGISPWVSVACLVGMPALVLLAALVPALRAHRLPVAQAISAGGAPQAGRGLRVQRLLGATRLPRPVSLGLGQPFARPGRTLLTMAAIVLGVTTVTLSTGLTSTMVAYANVGREDGGARIHVTTGGRAKTGLRPGSVTRRSRNGCGPCRARRGYGPARCPRRT